MSILDRPLPRKRVIDCLRKLYPGKWTYKQHDIDQWHHEDGWSVGARSMLPYGEDDESRGYTVYIRSDTNRQISLHFGDF